MTADEIPQELLDISREAALPARTSRRLPR